MTEKITWREDPINSGGSNYVGSKGDVIVALVSRNLNPVPNGWWTAYRCTPEAITPLYQQDNRTLLSFEQLADAQAAVETWINEQ